MQDLLGLITRISVMYVFALALLRLTGKRSLGDLSALDFIATLIIGDMFDDIFWAEIPFSQAVVGITTIAAIHVLLAYAQSRSRLIHDLINSKKTVIIEDGKLLETGMNTERFGHEEVLANLRMQGEDGPDEVRESSLESSGQLSLLKKEPAKRVQKQDLPRLEELFR